MTKGNPSFEGGEALARNLLRVRLGMLAVNEQLKAKAFRVPVHLALGHEAIAAALGAVMSGDDALCLTHRNIHYNLARAVSIRAELDELRLLDSGVAGGWLGSMNMNNPARGVIYTSSILANDLCVATGVALGAKVQGGNAATFVVTGDGALEEGTFHEALLILKSLDLAAVVVVENNGWSLATRIEERRCPVEVESLAAAFAIPYTRLSGNDVFDYAEQLARIRADALERRSPAIVEVGLHTLGDWHMTNADGSQGRHINYHHGAAGHVAFGDWPLIKDDADDPVHVLAARLGAEQARALAADVFASVAKEVAS